jgi:aminoglycoside phosphotransferase (APT) family kinase protein
MATSAADHPAGRAWLRVWPGHSRPSSVEELQHRRRSQVYRLRWPDGGTAIAKRCRAHMAAVERAAYAVLPGGGVPVPAYYGYLDDPSAGRADPFAWLFVGDLGGQRFSPGDAAQRAALANWLGRLQAALRRTGPAGQDRLPVRDAGYYRGYLDRARGELPTLAGTRPLPAPVLAMIGEVESMLRRVEQRWDAVAAPFASAPMTLVHGDCLPKNIQVWGAGAGVVPIDWGNAGWGLPALDLGLSALVLGDPVIGAADHDGYAEAIRPGWPACDPGAVRRLAELGRLLWSVKVIAMSVPGFRYDRIDKLAENLSRYAAVLRASLGGRAAAPAGAGR